jgi:hypothetical protein
MTDVLLRGVPAADLEQIRTAAAASGASVHAYLRDTVHAQAVHLRRQAALAAAGCRLESGPAVPEGERQAVLDAVDRADDDRGEQLAGLGG